MWKLWAPSVLIAGIIMFHLDSRVFLRLNTLVAVSSMQGDENSTAAIYGMASSMPAGPVNVLLRAYTDVTLGS